MTVFPSELLLWLREAITLRLRHYFGQGVAPDALPHLPASAAGAFGAILAQHSLFQEDFLLLTLALVPHIQPQWLERCIRESLPPGADFEEFGCVYATHSRSLLPTGEFALFVLAGHDLGARLSLLDLLGAGCFLARQRILVLEEVRHGEARLGGRLLLSPDYVALLTSGRVAPPQLSSTFPAQLITTTLEWDDLVLPPATLAQIRDLEHWGLHHAALRTGWGLERRIKPGYRALFYGPPGTGKTMTATLLGKFTGRDVFRVDLSLVSSKYIGETEKNLGSLFDRASSKNWILFFDEADALFGKRTETRDAHDRFANQEVAFLLQKMEEHDGLVILASNLRGNLDPAFARRFQAMIHFPLPSATERLRLWQATLPPPAQLAPDLHPEELAARYELSGATVLNVVQFAALRALGRGDTALTAHDITEAIRLEYQKEGKLL